MPKMTTITLVTVKPMQAQIVHISPTLLTHVVNRVKCQAAVQLLLEKCCYPSEGPVMRLAGHSAKHLTLYRRQQANRL